VNYKEFAFFLNNNAGKMNRGILAKITAQFPGAEIFLSHNDNESNLYLQKIIQENYRYLFLGGGDGTFFNFLNQIPEALNPDLLIGILGLGTGNGLATEVNSTHFQNTLNKIKKSSFANFSNYRLISTEGKFTHFSSVGLDAQVLNDFIRIKNRYPLLKRKYFGLPAYLLAYFLLSAKSEIIRRGVMVKVINEGEKVYRINEQRQADLLDLKPGEIIYEGLANLTGVATSSFYGFGFKVFPYARLNENLMNLRIANISNQEFLINPRSLWRGSYYNDQFINDYLVTRVRILFAQDSPWQIGGDAFGFRQEITYELSEKKVKILDFSQ